MNDTVMQKRSMTLAIRLLQLRKKMKLKKDGRSGQKKKSRVEKVKSTG